MIRNFFVLSPRGDTILAKQYHRPATTTSPSSSSSTSHAYAINGGTTNHPTNAQPQDRTHTEALFRTIKFWNDRVDSHTTAASNHFNGNEAGEGTEEGASSSAMAASAAATESSHSNHEIGGANKAEQQQQQRKCGDAPPVLLMEDGCTYFHIKRNGLLFGAASARNVSPTTVLSLLSTIARIFKDYCGTLSEEALRKNFILCYELLDEMLDYGYPQVTRTETLKSFVYNEPILVDAVGVNSANSIVNTGQMINPKTASANAVHKPVIQSVHENGRKSGLHRNQQNEIFVDILERLNVLFTNNGYVLNSTIDGCIQMKSYLAGNPELRLALNEDLVILSSNHSSSDANNNNMKNRYGASSVTVDDMNFNDCVNLTEFESARTLSFVPSDGEFVVLNYRITGEFATPFRIFPSVVENADNNPLKMEVTLLIRAEMPANHFGANVMVEMPLPSATVSASCQLTTAPGTTGGPSSAEYVSHPSGSGSGSGSGGSSSSSSNHSANTNKIVWTMKKFVGGSEQTLRVKVLLNQPCTSVVQRELGPINMCFEIPMYNVSHLQVRYLRVVNDNNTMVGYTPLRWVRYVTQSSSYVCRL